MKEYRVTIQMSDETVIALERSGNVLQVFRAVRSSDRAGRPLLWRRQDYSARTHVDWSDSLNAYTSTDKIEAGKEIHVGFYAAAAVGDVLRVHAGGGGEVTADGDPRAVSVQNTTARYFTCGLGGGAGGEAAAFCAFPLFGNNRQVLMPAEKIMLRFSTQAIKPGTVMGEYQNAADQTSFGPGVLADLAGAPSRELSYDMNEGWSWGGYTWARQISVGADIVPLLIEPDTAAA